jgi:hypothetical protein
MIIIVACLDVAVSNTTLLAIVVEFISRVLGDNVLDIKYLQHEILKHVEGWRSTACVRNMPPRVHNIWRSLESQNKHLPGFMPKGKMDEVVRILLWIVTGKTERTFTASSDVFCLAVLLEEMGFEMLRTGLAQDEFDESYITICFDNSTISVSPDLHALHTIRYRMRIPLKSIEESVSLWPGENNNDRRRLIFTNGMIASEGISISAHKISSSENSRGPGYRVIATDLAGRRNNPDAFRFPERYLLVVTSRAIRAIMDLIDFWAIHNDAECRRIVTYVERMALLDTDIEYLGDFQVFLLGYYYGALKNIIDSSELRLQEAFGSWGWYDLEFLALVEKLVKSRRKDEIGGYFLWHEILKVVVYLFGGGEKDQISSINYGIVGVISKLVVLNASLLGDADTVRRVGMFVLLDIDPTSIPSNARGLLSCAKQAPCIPQTAWSADTTTFPDLNGRDVDFTSQIEPAWVFDPNACLVTYRHKGRLVHKVNPIQIEASILD